MSENEELKSNIEKQCEELLRQKSHIMSLSEVCGRIETRVYRSTLYALLGIPENPHIIDLSYWDKDGFHEDIWYDP